MAGQKSLSTLLNICIRVFIAVIQHHGHKQLREERAYISLQFWVTFHSLEKSERMIKHGNIVEHEANAGTMKERLLLDLYSNAY